MIDAFRDLAPLLCCIESRANARRLFELLGCEPVVKRYPRVSADIYWTYPKAGLDALWSAGRLRAWFLNVRKEGCMGFLGAIDGGLSAQATRAEIHRAWGLPLNALKPETDRCDECKDHIIAKYPWRDSYERAGCSVFIEYSSGLHEGLVRPAMIIIQREFQPSRIKSSDPAGVSKTKAAVRCTFRCARCGRRAETVELAWQKPDPMIRVGFGTDLRGVSADDAVQLQALLLKGDAAALHAFRPHYAGSYCPKCKACYCLRHWKGRHAAPPPWGDSYSWDMAEYGACPYGHKRILREL